MEHYLPEFGMPAWAVVLLVVLRYTYKALIAVWTLRHTKPSERAEILRATAGWRPRQNRPSRDDDEKAS